MIDSNLYSYGFGNGKQGMEANYIFSDNILYVRILGADHISDYLDCLLAWPRKRIGKQKFHARWYKMAEELYYELIPKGLLFVDHVEIMGHSMGGAVASILGSMLHADSISVNVTSVNSPKPGNRHLPFATLYYDGGDFIRFLPFFYPGFKNTVCYAFTKHVGRAHTNKYNLWDTFLEVHNELE